MLKGVDVIVSLSLFPVVPRRWLINLARAVMINLRENRLEYAVAFKQ